MLTATPPASPPVQAPPAAPDASRRGGGVPHKDLLQESRKLQQLVEQAEALRDPVGRALVHECLQALLSFYGDGLARVLEVVRGAGPGGQEVFDRLIKDPMVRGLLLIHGLHPQDLPTRLGRPSTRSGPIWRAMAETWNC